MCHESWIVLIYVCNNVKAQIMITKRQKKPNNILSEGYNYYDKILGFHLGELSGDRFRT